jgi:hypothetical protein
MNLSKCPECRAVANSGSSFRVFECRDCATRYCYLCPGTGGGKRCPRCGCSGYREAGRVVP